MVINQKCKNQNLTTWFYWFKPTFLPSTRNL